MNLKIKLTVFCFLLLHSVVFAQIGEYKHKREILNVTDEWHRLVLPDSFYGRLNQELNDLRIFGITELNDTVEAPFLLKELGDKINHFERSSTLINKSSVENTHFYTFEVSSDEAINELILDFKSNNFDIQITLEGSQDLSQWFSIIQGYRVLSINNELSNYSFTKVKIPSSKYHFYRLKFVSETNPEFIDAQISERETIAGKRVFYKIDNLVVRKDSETKETKIAINLQRPVRINKLDLSIGNSFDYYRPVVIEYLVDSLKTEQGWKYRYSHLANGMLNSLNENTFDFRSTTIHTLRIKIQNGNNQELNINSAVLSGYLNEITARFTEEANYFLCYGSNLPVSPSYDIARFKNRIPKELELVRLGPVVHLEKDIEEGTNALFENKFWLWLIMTAIILTLGWFTLKMIKKD